MSLYDLYPPMPAELEPYRGLALGVVPIEFRGCLVGQPCIEISSGTPVLLLERITPSWRGVAVLDLTIDCVRYAKAADLALALEEELPTFLSGESLYLIQHSSEYEDPLTCENSDISSLYGVRLNLIPQNVWGDMVGDFWFFDLDRQRKVLLMSYSGSGCLVEDPDAVAKWWVGACRLMLMVERTPGESMW